MNSTVSKTGKVVPALTVLAQGFQNLPQLPPQGQEEPQVCPTHPTLLVPDGAETQATHRPSTGLLFP